MQSPFCAALWATEQALALIQPLSAGVQLPPAPCALIAAAASSARAAEGPAPSWHLHPRLRECWAGWPRPWQRAAGALRACPFLLPLSVLSPAQKHPWQRPEQPRGQAVRGGGSPRRELQPSMVLLMAARETVGSRWDHLIPRKVNHSEVGKPVGKTQSAETGVGEENNQCPPRSYYFIGHQVLAPGGWRALLRGCCSRCFFA